MTFHDAVIAIADRFLTERSFELIVGPALADLELNSPASARPTMQDRMAVIRAVAGAFRDDAVRGSDLGTFAGLVLIPVCYYSFFFLLGLPSGMGAVPSGMLAGLGIAVVALSLGPVVVCYWPERQPRPGSTELP